MGVIYCFSLLYKNNEYLIGEAESKKPFGKPPVDWIIKILERIIIKLRAMMWTAFTGLMIRSGGRLCELGSEPSGSTNAGISSVAE